MSDNAEPQTGPVLGRRQQELVANILQEAIDSSRDARQVRRHIVRVFAALMLMDDPTFDRKGFLDMFKQDLEQERAA